MRILTLGYIWDRVRAVKIRTRRGFVIASVLVLMLLSVVVIYNINSSSNKKVGCYPSLPHIDLKEYPSPLCSRSPPYPSSTVHDESDYKRSECLLKRLEGFYGYVNGSLNFVVAEALLEEGDNEEALKYLRISAELGYPHARYMLAELYTGKNGMLEVDLLQAHIWFLATNRDNFCMRSLNDIVTTKSPALFEDASSRARAVAKNLTDKELAEVDKSLHKIRILKKKRVKKAEAKLRKLRKRKKSPSLF